MVSSDETVEPFVEPSWNLVQGRNRDFISKQPVLGEHHRLYGPPGAPPVTLEATDDVRLRWSVLMARCLGERARCRKGFSCQQWILVALSAIWIYQPGDLKMINSDDIFLRWSF